MNDILSIDTLLEILLAISLSTAAGFRVFVPLLVLSTFAVVGHIDLPSNLDWIENDRALIIFSVASILEITGYYIPWLDNFLDLVATPVAIIVGTFVSASIAPDLDPIAKWTLALVAGGGTAGTTKGLMNILRTVSTAISGGLTNPVLATIELGLAVILSVLAITVPIVAGVALLALLILVIVRAKSLITLWQNQKQKSALSN